MSVLFSAGNYAFSGRDHPWNRKDCAANGSDASGTVSVSYSVDPVCCSTLQQYRYYLCAVSGILGSGNGTDVDLCMERKMDARNLSKITKVY